MTPGEALKAGIALVPANRQRDGSAGSLSVGDNMTLQVLGQYYRGLHLSRRRMLSDSRDGMSHFDVRPRNPRLPYHQLSGGNQQKALLAKWLQTKPTLLALHEPTQGVDVGARSQISELILTTARSGTSVLCASTDYEQLEAICDRVLIFGRGRVVRELVGQEVTKDRLTEQCFNSIALANSLLASGVA
jgi:ribose transport system ATP-binding protein